ncbi:MAG: methyltransferase family protein [Syntrophobacteraceae bacterium]
MRPILSSSRFRAESRVRLSWIFGVILGLLLLISDSKWEYFPLFSTVLFSAGCVLAGIASLGRLWCSVYIAGFKTKSLITVGPYSLCRNPLYFFSLLGFIGVGLATETLTIPLILSVLFAIYYPGVIRSEEAKLLNLHKEAFESYRLTTPSLFPKLSCLNEPEEYVMRPKIFRRNLFDALWFMWFVAIMEILESLHEAGAIPVLIRLF